MPATTPGFAVSELSHELIVVFMYVSVQITNISLTILVAFESRWFKKKTYIHFSSNTFPIATVITNITGEFDLFMKIHSFNDRLQT